MAAKPLQQTALCLLQANATPTPDLPSYAQLQAWLDQLSEAILSHPDTPALQHHPTLTLGLQWVSPAESQRLNTNYRHQPKPTNILSFSNHPYTPTPDGQTHLGDLAICADLLLVESQAQHKPSAAHTAHLLIHGVLHLLNFDHIDPAEADIMETFEINLLAQLGWPSPYVT